MKYVVPVLGNGALRHRKYVLMHLRFGRTEETEVAVDHRNRENSAYPNWLRADGGMLCRCCCCQPVTEPR